MLRVQDHPRAALDTDDRARHRMFIAIGGVALALAGVAVWGSVLEWRGANLHLGAVPFYGSGAWRATWSIVIPVGLAAAIVTGGPRVVARLRWPTLLATTWVATVTWSIALAASAGWHAVTAPLTSRYDYAPALPAARALGLGAFLRTYVDRLGDYPVHVQGHPPGMVTLLWLLDAVGLRGSGWEAAVVIGVGATAPVAVLITVHLLMGERSARSVVLFLVLAPWTLFVATIGDAVFTAMAAWTVAIGAVAATRPSPIRAGAVAVAAGALGALTLHFTYGLVPFLVLLPGVVLLGRRRAGLALPAVVGAVTVTAVWATAGFWWFDGFDATRYWHDVGASVDRPYGYFLLANLVVLAVMLGPAVIAALTLRLGGWLAALVFATLIAVAVADLSGLSKAEVERIWLPFMPWITLAVIALVRRWPGGAARWLAAQAGLTIVLQAVIAWPW